MYTQADGLVCESSSQAMAEEEMETISRVSSTTQMSRVDTFQSIRRFPGDVY